MSTPTSRVAKAVAMTAGTIHRPAAPPDQVARLWSLRGGPGFADEAAAIGEAVCGRVTHLLTDPAALVAHLEVLETLAGAPFGVRPSAWPWSESPPANVLPSLDPPFDDLLGEDVIARIADEGVTVLGPCEAGRLLLNPRGLWELAGVLGEVLPDHWLPLFDAPPADLTSLTGPGARAVSTGDVTHEQHRFNRFIRAENERVNRLIRNLYLHFHLENYSERDLYDRICQEVANYFRADVCALYLVRYEPEEIPTGRGRPRLSRWLELVGAFGPWRRALRQKYVRRQSRTRYELPDDSDAEVSGLTRKMFLSSEPGRFPSGFDFRTMRNGRAPGPTRLRDETTHQVVWYQDSLYNSCRCMLFAPLQREMAAGEEGAGLHRHIGLILVENRSPHDVPGFTESAAGPQGRLFLHDEWAVAALRPYLRDLHEAVKVRKEDPFVPLHNNVGWHQYFDDHPLAAGYFEDLVRELRRRAGGPPEPLVAAYKTLAHWLERLVECLIRVEGWLQHLTHACRVMCGVSERPDAERPVPSLFNVRNLRAVLPPLEEVPSAFPPSDHIAGRLREALYGALAGGDDGARRRLLRLEAILAISGNPAAAPIDRAILVEAEPAESALKRLPERNGREAVRLAAEQEAERLIRGLGELRARHLHELLWDRQDEKRFTIPDALADRCPDLQFREALEQICDQLQEICGVLLAPGLRPRERTEYELQYEEEEARNTADQVRAVLAECPNDHDTPCAAAVPHQPGSVEEAGCRATRALAIAAMHADSFHRIDEKRLVFIASHITQVLDNHLLNQAGQRRLGLEPDAPDLLGLEPFGLELLSTIRSNFDRLGAALKYLVAREAVRAHGHESGLLVVVATLDEFVGNLRTCISGDDAGKVWTRVVEAYGVAGGARLLLDLHRRARLQGLDALMTDSQAGAADEPEGQASGERTVRVEFRASGAGDRRGEDCVLVLKCTEQGGIRGHLILGLDVSRAAVRRRDYAVLWSTRLALEAVFHVIQAAAEGSTP